MRKNGFNIIGDIHGRSVWKFLVDKRAVNVFVGDFFDPYSYATSFEQCRDNFLDIIAFKRKHPETVLLWGNHELHYLFHNEMNEVYTRFDYRHALEIRKLLMDYGLYFNGVAFSIDNRFLITHAGVSRYWYMQWIEKYDGQSPDYVAEQINNLWNLNFRPFTVLENMKFCSDEESAFQSPIWIRPWMLEKNNLFADTPYYQAFGHTQCDCIEDHDRLICVDCLQRASSSDNLKAMSLHI